MGAPKQKWTAEEEAALKARVVKHGSGKWRTILKDPEFSVISCPRSNVDLKDKWRNLSVTASGWGSREKARLALKRSLKNSKHDDNSTATSTVDQGVDEEIVDAKPLAMSSEPLKIEGPKRSFSRLEDLILEAIISLKEPAGSNKTALATYIEDRYLAPPDFKQLLSTKLKALTSSGRLIKDKRKKTFILFLAKSRRERSKLEAELLWFSGGATWPMANRSIYHFMGGLERLIGPRGSHFQRSRAKETEGNEELTSPELEKKG